MVVLIVDRLVYACSLQAVLPIHQLQNHHTFPPRQPVPPSLSTVDGDIQRDIQRDIRRWRGERRRAAQNQFSGRSRRASTITHKLD